MTVSVLKRFNSLNIPSSKKYIPKSEFAAFLFSKYPLMEITSKKQYEDSLRLFDGLNDALGLLKASEKNTTNKYLSQLGERIEAFEAAEFTDLYEGMTFADLIKELLDSNGLKRKDLIPIFGDKSQVSKYINKVLIMKMDHLEKLANVLNCKVSFLAENYHATGKK